MQIWTCGFPASGSSAVLALAVILRVPVLFIQSSTEGAILACFVTCLMMVSSFHLGLERSQKMGLFVVDYQDPLSSFQMYSYVE